METAKVSVNGWMDLENLEYNILKYYSALKEEERPAIWHSVGEPGGHYAEWNKSENDKCCMVSFICGIKKEKVEFIETVSRKLSNTFRLSAPVVSRASELSQLSLPEDKLSF